MKKRFCERKKDCYERKQDIYVGVRVQGAIYSSGTCSLKKKLENESLRE